MKKILLAVLFLFQFTHVAFADGNSSNLGNPVDPLQTLQNSINNIASTLNAYTSRPVGLFDTLAHDIFWTAIAAILGALFGFLLVVITERLKIPNAKIELIPSAQSSGRKLLKVKVVTFTKTWQKILFPFQNPAFSGKLKGQLITIRNGQEVVITNYRLKWDANPEPWDYQNNVPRPELIPAASQPQNFLSDDEDSTSVAIKHPNDSEFYIYDANYYVNPAGNKRNERKIILRLIFTSSSATAKKDFYIFNNSMNAFHLEEIKKDSRLQKLLQFLKNRLTNSQN